MLRLRLLAAVLFLWAGVLPGVNGQDRQQTSQALAAVNAAIVEIQDWLTEAHARQSREQQELREREVQIARLLAQVEALETAVAESRRQLTGLRAQRETLSEARDREAELLGQTLRAAYQTGRPAPLQLLLERQDPSATARLIHTTRVLTDYQLERIESYRAALAELEAVDRRVQDELLTLAQEQQRLDGRLAELAAARDSRAAALARLDRELNDRSSELEQLEVDRAELEALLAEIDRALQGIDSLADVPPFAARRGALPAPVSGGVSSGSRTPPVDGSQQRQGLVLAAEYGSPVRAVHPGQVVFADWLRGAGLLVIINHGEGYLSLYGGNEALAVEAGAWVDRGQVVATSGRGLGDTPGLYFEIRHRGTALDPEPWLEPRD